MKVKNSVFIDASKLPKSSFRYSLIKNKSANKVQFYESVLTSNLFYEEEMKLRWETTDETEKISDVDCKIAFVNYAGRRVKTWYAPQIAVPEGPYKFYGLPGLIVKMEDTQGFFRFELLNFKDVASQNKDITLSKDVLKSTKTTKKKFLAAKENLIKNFEAELKNRGITIGGDGVKMMKEMSKKENNDLERKP